MGGIQDTWMPRRNKRLQQQGGRSVGTESEQRECAPPPQKTGIAPAPLLP